MSEKIIKISEEINPEEQKKAEGCHQEIIVRIFVTAGNLLELGRLFKTIRDEKLYKLLGASTFTEYCGFPEIKYAKTTIYSFIHIYELYVLKLNYHPKTLCKIGHRGLQIIAPVIKDYKRDEHAYRLGEWMEKAAVLSESDLINEVRVAQGKPEMLPIMKELKDKEVYPFNYNDYVSFVRAHPCLVCDDADSEFHHFPRTKGAGGKDEHGIPLCRGCHRDAQDDPFDFLWLHKDKIFEYFYTMFLKSFALYKMVSEK